MNIIQKILTYLLIIIILITIYLIIDVRYINNGYKGISNTDILDISFILFSIIIVKIILKKAQ